MTTVPSSNQNFSLKSEPRSHGELAHGDSRVGPGGAQASISDAVGDGLNEPGMKSSAVSATDPSEQTEGVVPDENAGGKSQE